MESGCAAASNVISGRVYPHVPGANIPADQRSKKLVGGSFNNEAQVGVSFSLLLRIRRIPFPPAVVFSTLSPARAGIRVSISIIKARFIGAKIARPTATACMRFATQAK